MSTIATKPLLERQPGPYPANRSCSGCGAHLSRYNPATVCAPCNRGEWSLGDDEVWAALEKASAPARQAYFETLEKAA